jgi:hypothetical protein
MAAAASCLDRDGVGFGVDAVEVERQKPSLALEDQVHS